MKVSIFYMFLVTPFFSQDVFRLDLDKANQLKRELKNEEALNVYMNILRKDSTHVFSLIESSILMCEIGFLKEDDEEKTMFYKKAVLYSKKAVSLSEGNAQAHLAVARSVGRLAQVMGAKEKIRLSVEVKHYAENTIKLDPNNDIAYHIIGKWNFKISDLSWVETLAANAVLGGVPEGASFENAKEAFLKAVEIKPHSISHNVELAKTYIELGQELKAKEILQKAIHLPVLKTIDQNYLNEAKELLEDL